MTTASASPVPVGLRASALRRLRAGAIHLVVSLGVASLAATLVFWLWYPGAHRTLADGLGLFLLVVSVDVILGPLLTVVACSQGKPRRELVRDLALIAALQGAALVYGIHVMAVARPVHVVYEIDRFRVVTAAEIDARDLAQAPPALQTLPWTGPTTIAARRGSSGEEVLAGITNALSGVEISMQPARWVPYDAAMRAEAVRRAAPLADRVASWPADRRDALRARAEQLARDAGIDPAQVRLLPVQSRFVNWTTVLAPDGDPIGFLDVDGF